MNMKAKQKKLKPKKAKSSLRWTHLPYFSSSLLGALALFLFFGAVLMTKPKTIVKQPEAYPINQGAVCKNESDLQAVLDAWGTGDNNFAKVLAIVKNLCTK